MFNTKSATRLRAKTRIRKKIFGTPEMPRLTVYRSLNHIYAQLIDDINQTTLVSVSTLSKEVQDELKNSNGKIEKGKLIGKFLAQKSIEKNISKVVFDRNGYQYHGRIKAVADGAREGGLQF